MTPLQRSVLLLYEPQNERFWFVTITSRGFVMTPTEPGDATFERDVRAFLEEFGEPIEIDWTPHLKDKFAHLRWMGTYYYEIDTFHVGNIQLEDTKALCYIWGESFAHDARD